MAELSNDNQKTVPTGPDAIRQAVENANRAEDESQGDDDSDAEEEEDDDGENNSGDDSEEDGADDDSENGDDADEDEDEGEDDDTSKTDKKTDPKPRKFTQFAGDGTDESYISNIEKAYQNTSAEGIRLNQELEQANTRIDAIMQAATANPELAKMLNEAMGKQKGSGKDGEESSGADAAVNPFVKSLQTEWQDKSLAEIAEFIGANPEVETDPQIKADVKYWMNVISNAHYNRTGKLMSGGKAMAEAFKHLGLENKLGKQNLASGAKKHAAPTRPRGKTKRAGGQKSAFTPDQIAMAKSMGRDQAWLEKNSR